MANHCYNHISITDISDVNLKRLEKFLENINKNEHGMGYVNFYEIAKAFKHRDEYEGIHIGNEEEFYERNPNFDPYDLVGSKWFQMYYDLEDLTISGDSAWGPVCPLIKMMAEEFDFEFEGSFEEGGCCIYGVYSIIEGFYIEEEMERWEWYEKEGDIWNEIDWRLEDDMLDEQDLEEIKNQVTKETYREICDHIAEYESGQAEKKEERDNWLIIAKPSHGVENP